MKIWKVTKRSLDYERALTNAQVGLLKVLGDLAAVRSQKGGAK